jgi:hypothetical protein
MGDGLFAESDCFQAKSTPPKPKREKQRTEPVSRHTIEQIGRELRNAYPLPDDMPTRLRTLVEHLEREITRSENHKGEKEGK